ncbi:chloride channel protein CLC-e isoform X2 [Impatiens glandulifera]|uniref:chloride channel protein CLC-e isoform X2 n=1 Tax=Impatiens glandulifera TaxID=253017 RepID=UPI001FB17DD2|nr:chloride channel protein CLC-e isoform X2 [Impatiens glandulifera]
MLGMAGGGQIMGQLLLNTHSYSLTPPLPLIFDFSYGSSFRPSYHYITTSTTTIQKKLVNNNNNVFHRLQFPLSSRYMPTLCPRGAAPDSNQSETCFHDFEPDDDDRDSPAKRQGDQFATTDNKIGSSTAITKAFPSGNSAIISACFIGLLTGVSVVIFNISVHELRDLFWDGIPYRGASWLREEPIEAIWQRVVAVPVCGGLVVSILNVARGYLEVSTRGTLGPNFKSALEPVLKAMAASVTLGTGNSLGPEGPSVEIGASIAKGVGTVLRSPNQISLIAAGSAAGISSGFNAAVAGCFFAVESVLWPSTSDSSSSLANTTSMVILSAVIASVVSEIGLGSEPAFTVPEYDFHSPTELPLYLLLGILCGLVSLTLSKCTSFMLVSADNMHKNMGMPKVVFPILGGLSVGLMALAYPEILYWGFQNVDILLESRPFVKGLTTDMLLQLVAVKIVATSLCRASGLVGGFYAPSLFIGAATGMAYGKIVSYAVTNSEPFFHLSFLDVASPQAYGLVGMAATLAGVCQVPLTAVLLLFELTQDYRIVLPLLGAVGMSSWITSGNTLRTNIGGLKKPEGGEMSSNPDEVSTIGTSAAKGSDANNLCEIESSLCIDDYNYNIEELGQHVLVSQAMRTRYVTALSNTPLIEAVNLMLLEKQSCALVVDDNNVLISLLTLGDIQEFSQSEEAKSRRPETIMVRNGIDQVPVMEQVEGLQGQLVGILDKESITLSCRIIATGEFLNLFLINSDE